MRLPLGPRCESCGLGPRPERGKCTGCLPGEVHWDVAWQAAQWTDPVPTLIHGLKYGDLPEVARPLAGWTAAQIRRGGLLGEIDLVVPVPLHRVRERERGYNQSALFARHLARGLQVPSERRVLVRHRATASQTRLSRAERLVNVRDAFRCARPELVRGLSVLLVDDVHTTGSTLNESALALRQAGAARIVALAFARAS